MKAIEKIEETIFNYRILPFKQTEDILVSNVPSKNEKNKTIYVVAGPNGSGKSTFIANMYAMGLLSHYQYVNADVYAKLVFSYLKDETEKNYEAMKHTTKICNSLIEEGISFVYETVLSHPSKLELVEKCKELGYKVISIFVTTQDPQINVGRVAIRTSQGGHFVPPDKIIARYERSNENAKELCKLSDTYFQIDNSKMPTLEKVDFNYNKHTCKIMYEEK